MEFGWSGEQNVRYEACRDFAQKELNQELLARDSAQAFAMENWRKCGEFGVLGWCMPTN